jgi:SAM-dependent methyltransferase
MQTMNNRIDEQYKQMWDERYSKAEYAYGKEPNVFFKECLQGFQPGSILLPADGEGRNGVFAAELGWTVTSFDLSPEGKTKALQLAKERNVSIDYEVGELEQLAFRDGSFDAIALVYAHVAPEKKTPFHKHLQKLLKAGGVVIMEAFSKNHLPFVSQNPKVGGPRELDMLFSTEEIMSDFKGFDILLLEEKEVTLAEGIYHNGMGSVVRFIGIKRSR